MAVIVYSLFLYFRNWKKLWVSGPWETSRYVQAGAGIGVLLMLFHTAVDFNLHKPVNAAYFALILAVFMRAGLERYAHDSADN